MKKLLLFACLLLTNPAHATTYTAASDSALTYANSIAAPGDSISISSGTYTTAIAPSDSGTAPARIIYAGIGTVCLPALTTPHSYLTIRNINFTPTDSTTNIMDLSLLSHDISIYNSTFTGDRISFEGENSNSTFWDDSLELNPVRLDSVLIEGCSFTLDHVTTGAPAIRMMSAYGTTIRNSTFHIHTHPTGSGGMFKRYTCQFENWTDNHFTLLSDRTYGTGDEVNMSYWRDFTSFNTFLRDTFDFTGSNKLVLWQNAAGHWVGSNRDNNYTSCLFRSTAPASEVGFFTTENGGARLDTLAYCTLIAQYGAPYGLIAGNVDSTTITTPVRRYGYSTIDSCAIYNNDFIRLGGDSAATTYGCVAIATDKALGTNNTVRDNIFYHLPGTYTGRDGCALYTAEALLDTLHWRGSYNLFYGTNTTALIYINSVYGYSPAYICDTYKTECNGVRGDPLFVGGTTALDFNPRLTKGSPAINTSSTGEDIGAYDYSDSVTLTYTAGAHVLLAIESGWTTPCKIPTNGNGPSVTAAVTDVRYSFNGWSDGITTRARQDTSVSADLSVTAVATPFVTLTYVAGAHGSITGDCSQSIPRGGDGDTVIAVPDSLYSFVYWSDQNTNPIRCDQNVVYPINRSACFILTSTPWNYRLNYTSGLNGKLIGPTEQWVLRGTDGDPINAIPNTGYTFLQWSDYSIENPRTDTDVQGNVNVKATFKKQ